MDTKRAIHNLPIHKHPLFPSAMFRLVECGGCHVEETIYGGYFCNEPYCNAWFHKECAEAPPEINHHPSHLEHPLLLTNDSQSRDGPCDFCGKKLFSPCYLCLTCEFKVDFICGIKPSPSTIEHPVCHDHSLVFLKKRGEEEVQCEVCKESIGGPSYSCPECNNVYFHLDCIHLSKEVNHPCHSNHPLKIIAYESLKNDYDLAKRFCRLCLIPPKEKLYHCSVCNFTLCLGCTKLPPPLVVNHAKTHMHPLRLVSVKLAFTCKVCGINGDYVDTKPYICLKCTFLVHGNCVGFPRVININRHDHRIYFTYHHDPGRCGVCRKDVSQYYGAYSCSVCPNYTVHSRCAVDSSVWNGVELEGTPEREEDIVPFKVVGHYMIQHFSHSKHILRLLKDNVIQDDEFIRCEACIRPLGVGPVYNCVECRFVLHEKCANLPKKKRLVFDPTPYTLECDNPAVYCKLCGMFSGGFVYTSKGTTTFHCVDVHCGFFSEPVVHNKHSHPLYFVNNKYYVCDACKRVPDDYMLSCAAYACNFHLCLYCAALPEKIWHMSDEHPLTLSSCVGNASDQNWCDVCESELDPSKWFYTCSDCELAFHVQCVLGDFSRLKPECLYTFGKREFKVVLNNRNTRPFCSHCHSRSKVPVILKDNGMDIGYICSGSCLSSCLGVSPRNEM